MKRLFDIIAAGLALILLSPILALVALAILARDGSPVLFRQDRPGRGGTIFSIIKFRTMQPTGAGDDVHSVARVTPLGRFLRATSLDELPELWNVLTGDMSLVGPRPLLTGYLPLYTAEQARRHEVRPGLTGLAQISGRNALGWDEKFALDVWYVDHRSLWLDFKIIAGTVRQLLRRSQVDASGSQTMPVFTGARVEKQSEYLVFGAGGHAKVVIEAIRTCEPDAAIIVLDDDPAQWGRDLLGIRIAGGREAARAHPGATFIPAIGANSARRKLVGWALEQGIAVGSVIHPSAIVSPSAQIGPGCFLAPGSILNADARLGRGVIINTGASVDHDCVIGDGGHIAPGARLCGNVRVGTDSLVGVGAVVIPGIVIGDGCRIRAGSAVIRSFGTIGSTTEPPARLEIGAAA